MKFKTVHSKPKKSGAWRFVKLAGLGLLTAHALHRRHVKKKNQPPK